MTVIVGRHQKQRSAAFLSHVNFVILRKVMTYLGVILIWKFPITGVPSSNQDVREISICKSKEQT